MAGDNQNGPGGPSRREKGGPGPRRPGGPGPPRKPGPPRASGPKRPGSIRLASVGGNRFELIHPGCVRETEPDYQEGMEIREAGDPEGARDALRYALAACRDNLWIHSGLGRIALEDFRDPALARGHFGYAVELVHRAIPPGFAGLLATDRPANRPFYDALDGLIGSLEALGQVGDVAELRSLRERLSGRPGGGGKPGSRRPDPGP